MFKPKYRHLRQSAQHSPVGPTSRPPGIRPKTSPSTPQERLLAAYPSCPGCEPRHPGFESGCFTVYQGRHFPYEVGPVHHRGDAETVSVEFAGIVFGCRSLVADPRVFVSRYFSLFASIARRRRRRKCTRRRPTRTDPWGGRPRSRGERGEPRFIDSGSHGGIIPP